MSKLTADFPTAETYSDNGPQCPYCGYLHQPEGGMYSEDYNEEECWNCGKAFSVSVYHSISWSCEPLDEPDAGRLVQDEGR